MFTVCTPFVCGCGGGGGGGSSHSSGGTFRRGGGGDVVGEESVDGGRETGGGGLRSLRMKRALVVLEGGSGSSLVGLGEREEVVA